MEALLGCAIGDAHGERYFGPPEVASRRIQERRLPDVPAGGLRWTDDTLQSASVVAVLERYDGDLPQDALVQHLARSMDMDRGYGHGSRELLWAVRHGADWRHESATLFGAGSYGNGAAMRAAVVGAWHAGDPDRAGALAAQQAAVTHHQQEGRTGAAAVAAVASMLAGSRGGPLPSWRVLLDAAQSVCPPGKVQDGVRSVVDLVERGAVGDDPASIAHAASVLGTGREGSAWDTVPFVLWSLVQSADDLEATFWRTVAGLGDRDTTCAIACALVACRTGADATLRAWAARVEPLPASVR
ncbi:ADP-ribosylglycohydrolase family protein [Aquipuribacter hungaricus]|uniref:ADP-ribosylglycohydrolase family protein n=1 Tax=Aquipuribacter hungaricus TaxID=545624 RepID=A0ABV7WCI7_9MICO